MRKRKNNFGVAGTRRQEAIENEMRERSDRDQMAGLPPRRAPAPKSAAEKNQDPARFLRVWAR